MIHYVFESLIGRINYERVPVIPFQYDCILDTKLVVWKLLHLPVQAVGRFGQELHIAEVATVF